MQEQYYGHNGTQGMKGTKPWRQNMISEDSILEKARDWFLNTYATKGIIAEGVFLMSGDRGQI